VPGSGTAPVLLKMSNMRKSFGSVVALNDAEFEVFPSEVHGLLGGNGAGKTTLMNVLFGLYKPDGGQITWNGQEISIGSPREAINRGIGMVHQNFLQVLGYTVAENIVLGVKPSTSPDKAVPRITELCERFGLALDTRARAGELSVGARQRLEILKVLYRGARLIILDEPTTNLTPQEVEALFGSLRKIVNEGMSVVFISHKIREVLAVCDRMTVMRNGATVSTVLRAEIDATSLASLMTGEQLSGDFAAMYGLSDFHGLDSVSSPDAAESTFAIRDLTVSNEYGVEAIKGVSFEVRPGEVVGIAGVAGNGQTELVEAITGNRNIESGSISISGSDLSHKARARWIEAGVAYVPEDRHRDGILGSASVMDNLLLGAQRSLRFGNGRWIRWAKVRDHAENMIRQYAIKTSGPDALAGLLSGGNIQRVVLARAFSQDPTVLILHNPTRGLDLDSTRLVYQKVKSAIESGTRVVLVSEDLDELTSLSDRIHVLFSGRLVGSRERDNYDALDLGTLMAGLESSK
jgi:ABC-type uncharacterized transport system ATPase subunit